MIRGARVHNLKSIDVTIPRDQFVVITGLSGSGKSSLAFDTIYAEGQRRYVESFRRMRDNFWDRWINPMWIRSKACPQRSPSIKNQPAVILVQRWELLRKFMTICGLLFARIGPPYCPKHGLPITSQTIPQMVDRIKELPERTRIANIGAASLRDEKVNM